MNRCSKLSRYVYEIPNAFIGRILQAEPKKLAEDKSCSGDCCCWLCR